MHFTTSYHQGDQGRSRASAHGVRAALGVLMLCGALLTGVGCSTTTVRRETIPPEVFELAARNAVPLCVSIESDASTTAGRQFLLVLIPLARVEVESPADMVYGKLYPLLADAGVKPISREARKDCAGAWGLALLVHDVSVSAYDLLFTRRVSAHISLDAQLVRPDGAELPIQKCEGRASRLRRYGFEPQLRQVLDAALDDALRPVVVNLAGTLPGLPRTSPSLP